MKYSEALVVGEAGGIVRYRYSDRDTCVCCNGRHVYNRYVEHEESEPTNWSLWVHRQLAKVPEGRHVRIVVLLSEDV